MRITLASTSPRRKEILSYFTLPFEVKAPNFEEKSIPFGGDPIAYASALAQGKARSLEADSPVLGADTIVVHRGQVFGKPANDEEAFENLCILSGQWHSVITAVSDGTTTLTEETRVLFRRLTPDQIRRYVKAIKSSDKAGGYAIQMSGSLIVQRIEGCYYNVLGLPIGALHDLLLTQGIDLWDYLSGPSPSF